MTLQPAPEPEDKQEDVAAVRGWWSARAEHETGLKPPSPTPVAEPELPPAPTAEESKEQKTAYDASAQRLEDIVRAQNPGMGAQPPVGFEHLVQQLYVSAMIQMGAGAQEGQRPRVDILGARNTIDLLGVLAEKTKGNLDRSRRSHAAGGSV